MNVIKAENLGKKYIISHQQERGGKSGKYTNLRDVISEKIGKLSNKLFNPFTRNETSPHSAHEEFWALRNVSFEIKQGERVGIIGRNGAGKSTLLKILSRITEPTTGRVSIKGRIASLLEVGTGFHPELTGRENIYLNGAILGMAKIEIKKNFDEIVAFAEVEKFLDTPVKRYSSGMYVRLAFAVAAHLEPEILVVDEVLAVGDAQFQKKCLGKMEEVGREGRTVLFVSHNMTALKILCSRAMLLDKGDMVTEGETQAVVNHYLQNMTNSVLEQVWENRETAPGNDKVRLRSARIIINDEEHHENVIRVDTPLKIEFECWNLLQEAELNFSMSLYNAEGLCIFNTVSPAVVYRAGLIRGVCAIPGNILNDETYSVMIMIVKDMSVPLFSKNDVLVFEVKDIVREGAWYGKWHGVVRPKLVWNTEFIQPTVQESFEITYGK